MCEKGKDDVKIEAHQKSRSLFRPKLPESWHEEIDCGSLFRQPQKVLECREGAGFGEGGNLHLVEWR